MSDPDHSIPPEIEHLSAIVAKIISYQYTL